MCIIGKGGRRRLVVCGSFFVNDDKNNDKNNDDNNNNDNDNDNDNFSFPSPKNSLLVQSSFKIHKNQVHLPIIIIIIIIISLLLHTQVSTHKLNHFFFSYLPTPPLCSVGS